MGHCGGGFCMTGTLPCICLCGECLRARKDCGTTEICSACAEKDRRLAELEQYQLDCRCADFAVELDDAKRERDGARSRIAELEQAVARCATRVASVARKCGHWKNQSRSVARERDEARDEVARLREENDQLAVDLAVARSDRARLQVRCADRIAECEDVALQMATTLTVTDRDRDVWIARLRNKEPDHG